MTAWQATEATVNLEQENEEITMQDIATVLLMDDLGEFENIEEFEIALENKQTEND